jgi:hypothetical protein
MKKNLFSSLFPVIALMSAGVVGEDGGGAVADITVNEQDTKPVVVATGATQVVHTPEEKAAYYGEIKAKFDDTVDVVEVGFHFRKVTDAKTKIETKRNSVILPLPVPSVEGLIAIIQNGGKGLELLMEAAREVIVDQAREYINDNEDTTSLNFPFATMTWETIANLPKTDRRGGGIAKDVWEEFSKDYIAIMPALINKDLEAVTTAAKIFLTKFAAVKTSKPVLNKLRDYLAIYINNTARGEEFAEPVDWLDKKIGVLLETGDQALLNAL